MNFTPFIIGGTLLVNVVLGSLVFLTNRKRAANRYFLLFSAIVGAWLVGVWLVFSMKSAPWVEFMLRQCHVVSLLMPFAIDQLRQAIIHPDDRLGQSWRPIVAWLSLTAVIGIMCQTDLLLTAVVLPFEGTRTLLPKPVFGPGVFVWEFYYLGAWVYVGIRYFKDIRRLTGIQRTELQFPMLGCSLGLVLGIFFGSVLPAISPGGAQYAPLAALSALVMDLVIAYGIATRRILSVAHILRRATAYGLLSGYTVLLYLATWWLASAAAERLGAGDSPAPHLLAALCVAFSMAPAHGRMQGVATRLFVNAQQIDLQDLWQKTHEVLRSIGTVDQLTERFAGVIAATSGAEKVAILLREEERFRQVYPPEPDTPPQFPAEDTLIRQLQASRAPVSADTIRRMPPSERWTALGRRLDALKCSLAVAIQSKGGMDGILLLGPRLSGKIYGAEEQDALQLVCGQFGVSLENAKLYTDSQHSKIYNDILLDNLASGVVAADPKGRITVCNREACHVLGIQAHEAVGHAVSVLPAALGRIMDETLEKGRSLRDEDLALELDRERTVYVRLATTLFTSLEGNTLGVLMVFHDITAIKALQEQVRRTDRLASLGTLSAGMAHEVKNPLVTIKTFTQLLPERYEDPDFRENFTALVGDEVKRIDSIVSQLLAFSRPSKPSLARTRMHEVLENSLRLLQQQFRKKDIAVVCRFEASEDGILGDADLLSQAFVNFLLNAQDAMEEGGRLTVSTSVESTNGQSPPSGKIRVVIQDTGVGIRPQDLAHIFDPFFTTKANGTGLGLSVTHGIVEEQRGVIEVESDPGLGTRVHVVFPLMPRESVS